MSLDEPHARVAGKETSSMSPYDLLALRHPDYAKAQERHLRALEQQRGAEEYARALERELAAAEEAVGDALVDGTRPSTRKTEQLRADLEKDKTELAAIQSTVERVGEALDRMPIERRDEWLRHAHRDFQAARADFEEVLAGLVDASGRIEQEAQLLNFLTGQTNAVRVPRTLRIHVSGVEGLVGEAPTANALDALHDYLFAIEIDTLVRARP
jgi:hypothetical protein